MELDILAKLGLNASIIAGIIGITAVIKRGLPVERKNLLLLSPILLGCLAGLAMARPLEWQVWLEKSIAYAGVSVLAYEVWKANKKARAA